MAMSSDSHLLSLKVVRLSQPGDALHNSLYKDLDPSIPAGKAMDSLAVEGMTSSIASESDISIAGLGSFQTLSQPFGNIYLGETFSSCLCVTNESSIQVLNLSFKAELQTSTQRLTLADTLASSSSLSSTASSERVGAGGMLGSYTSLQGSSAAGTQGGRKSLANSLLPSQSVEFIINHDIKELGIHILVCSVHYTPAPAVGSVPTGHDRERKFFRKFYKFQVLNPLSVKTKVNTLADGRIFLEAQVQNVSSTSMYLERMNFEPNEPFLLVNLNQFPCAADAKGVDLNEDKEPHANAVDSQDLMSTAIPPLSKDRSVFGPKELLGQQDTRQYLYMLTPKSVHDIASRMLPGLGKLDISWKTLLGQSGRLQTSQLSRKTPLVDPFEVSVISQPDVIKVEQPFKIKIRITNHMPGDRLKLSIHGFKSKMTTVLLRGPNDIELGGLEGASHMDVDLEFFSLAVGLQKITGIQVLEKVSSTTRNIESLAVVRVVS